MPATATLDAETILTTTEQVLRRHGPAKATVLDVARALGVSHGSIYRHFPSKAALREAVTRRWIDRARDALAAAATNTEVTPPERLRGYVATLFAAKRAKAREDPELQAAYQQLVAEHSTVVADHVAELVEQLRVILADGMATGDFASTDPHATARAVFDATTRFHHPAHAAEWQKPGIETECNTMCSLLIDGLRTR